jgi:hypothetical protein
MAQNNAGTFQRTASQDSGMRAFESYFSNLVPHGITAGPTAAEARQDWLRREEWITYQQTKWM